MVPGPHPGSQGTVLVLHGQTVLGGHVQRGSWEGQEVQPLDEDGQEEVDFISCNDLSNAAALPHSEHHHLLPFRLVDLGAISTQETVWVEGRRVVPLPTETAHKTKWNKGGGGSGSIKECGTSPVPLPCQQNSVGRGGLGTILVTNPGGKELTDRG